MKLIIFILVSIPIVWYSWPTMKKPDNHGFFRFFAFEGTVLIILHNMDAWFKNPFNLIQLVSWFFLIFSLCLALYGFFLLRQRGKPEGNFEATTQLVSTGIYRYIRHPMYASLLYLSLGAFLKAPGFAATGMLVAVSAFLFATARVEENENLQHFGQAYGEYMKSTKMFVPWIF